MKDLWSSWKQKDLSSASLWKNTGHTHRMEIFRVSYDYAIMYVYSLQSLERDTKFVLTSHMLSSFCLKFWAACGQLVSMVVAGSWTELVFPCNSKLINADRRHLESAAMVWYTSNFKMYLRFLINHGVYKIFATKSSQLPRARFLFVLWLEPYAWYFYGGGGNSFLVEYASLLRTILV